MPPLIQSRTPVISAIPVEIWSLCFSKANLLSNSNLSSRSTPGLESTTTLRPTIEILKALSQTCKLFRDICQPHLFKVLLLKPFVAMFRYHRRRNNGTNLSSADEEGQDEEEGTRFIDTRTDRWVHQAQQNQKKLEWFLEKDNAKFVTYLQHLSFFGVKDEEIRLTQRRLSLVEAEDEGSNDANPAPVFDTAYADMINVFQLTLGMFTSLQTLHLHKVDLNERVVAGLCQLTRLESLYLHSPIISRHGISKSAFGYTSNSTKLIRTRSLFIADWDSSMFDLSSTSANSPFRLELFSLDGLQVLEIDSSRYAVPIMTHLTAQASSAIPSPLIPQLKAFRTFISLSSLQPLFEFFEACCANLTSLSVTNSFNEYFQPTYPKFLSSTMPSLEFYSGIGSLAELIIPGRPVKDIMIEDVWVPHPQHPYPQRFAADHARKITDPIPASVISAIKKSTAHIEKLSLPFLDPHPGIFQIILDSYNLKDLKVLKVGFSFVEEDEPVELLSEDENWNILVNEESQAETDEGENWKIEVDEGGIPKRSPTSVKGIFEWICTNNLLLPPNITFLSIVQQAPHVRSFEQFFNTFLSYKQQRSLLVMLERYYPSLEKVTIGKRSSEWEKQGGFWKPTTDYEFFLENKHLFRQERSA